MRSREEHFRLLADSVPQLVWTAGPDGRIEYMSARRKGTEQRAERIGKGSFIPMIGERPRKHGFTPAKLASL